MALRFLMRKKEKLLSGAEFESFYTIDNSAAELERALSAGGSSEDQYEVHELIGVEVFNLF